MYKSLEHFINHLEEKGELITISTEVSTNLEMAEIIDRICKQPDGGKAILFENVKNSQFPVVANLMGSYKRMAHVFSSDSLEETSQELSKIFTTLTTPRKGVLQKLSIVPFLGKIGGRFPKRTNRKLSQHTPLNSLLDIPAIKCWPYDKGHFITLPMVFTKDPETGIGNVGMYRIQIIDDKSCFVHWQKHKTGARHFDKYKQRGVQRMPVAIAVGGDPIYTYAATAPLPEGIDEMMLAGILRKKAVNLVKCQTVDLEVPEDCDFVIEGYVDTTQPLELEGPFGDHTGYYSLPDFYPKLHVTSIRAKKGAIYPTTIVGIPPQEDVYIAYATEKIFSTPIQLVVQPFLKEMHLPPAGIAHNLALITYDKQYEGHSLQVMNSLWGAGQMSFTKVMVVSEHGNPMNYEEFANHCLANFIPNKDVTIQKGPADVLDHAARQFALGGKIGLDCSGNNAPVRWQEYIKVKVLEKGTDTRLFAKKSIQKFTEKETCSILLLLDDAISEDDLFSQLWIVLNNIDPSTDCWVENNTLVFDGTKKVDKENFNRPWPNMVTMNLETIEKVDQKWESFNIGALIPSPSRKFLSLREYDEAFYKHEDMTMDAKGNTIPTK